jgi:uncharacterized DUF497 family protein
VRFEWHDAKDEANIRTHGISFDLAKTVFNDPFAVEWLDESGRLWRATLVTIGMATGQVLGL